MFPVLDGFDHIHIYVKDRQQAAKWYEDNLGFTVNQDFKFWADDANGPLTIEDATGKIHLALFQREDFRPGTSLAMKASGQSFLQWKELLERKKLLIKCMDHDVSWSLYFKDLDDNRHEITTYEYEFVAGRLV